MRRVPVGQPLGVRGLRAGGEDGLVQRLRARQREAHVVVELARLPGLAELRVAVGIAGRLEGVHRDLVGLDVVGVRVAAALVVGGDHLRLEPADQRDQRRGGLLDRRRARSSPRAAAAAGRPRAGRSRRSRGTPARRRGSPGPGPSPRRGSAAAAPTPRGGPSPGSAPSRARRRCRWPPAPGHPRPRTSPSSRRPCSTRRPDARGRRAAATGRVRSPGHCPPPARPSRRTPRDGPPGGPGRRKCAPVTARSGTVPDLRRGPDRRSASVHGRRARC